MAKEILFGIDLGGTKIEGTVIRYDASKPHMLETISRIRIPTEKEKGYQHIINQIKELTLQLEEASGEQIKHLGIGTPGAIDPTSQLMKNSNTTCLNGRPFHKDLQTALGYHLVMANDANCFALAETKLGIVQEKLPDANVVFGVIMGTGVGGGVVVEGKVIHGKHGIGGEWGHNFLHESGGDCYCGKIGCVETILSGTGLQKYYFEKTGKKIPLKEIYQKYVDKQDEFAIATIKRLINYFGKGLASIINILDPDAIVLGGGVGNIPELYTAGKEAIKEHIFNPDLQTAILQPNLGDSAGVFGAALLTRNH
ncbi:MAG: ROK family protein [Bacteroidota bacterium]